MRASHDRRALNPAVAFSSLFVFLAGCTAQPLADTRAGSEFLVPPPHAVDRWELHLNFSGSGVYVATAQAYPLRHHAEYEAEILAIVYANQRSSFIAAELSVFNRTENRDGGGAGGNFQPARQHVGLSAWANGQNALDPIWIVDNPLGFDGGGGRSSGEIAGPKPDETHTLMLVVAYATEPDDDHPLPATVDVVVVSPERNLVPLDSSHRAGGTGAASYSSGELHGTDGIGITTGETALGVEANVTFTFSTQNDTMVQWYAHAPRSPGAQGLSPLRIPTGQLDLTVTNSSGSRQFDLGLNQPHWDVFHDYFRHGGEAWDFTLNVRGRADFFVAYADVPLASTWNLLVCNHGTELC